VTARFGTPETQIMSARRRVAFGNTALDALLAHIRIAQGEILGSAINVMSIRLKSDGRTRFPDTDKPVVPREQERSWRVALPHSRARPAVQVLFARLRSSPHAFRRLIAFD
jgi:hypothetical protein